jgi:SAM-dependent methyltransferase
MARFDETYYARHGTGDDRIALWWYARVLRRLRPQGGRLLDFGCGTGHLLKRLTGHFTAYGYDPSPYARGECRIVAPQAVVLDDWLSLEPASLNAVVALHCLEHLPSPQRTVDDLADRLARGGLFFAVVPNTNGLGRRLKGDDWFGYRDPTHCSLLSPQEWVTVFNRARLSVDSVRGDGMWDPPYIPALPALVQRAVFGAPAALQVFSPLARPFLPPLFGECLIIQARR